MSAHVHDEAAPEPDLDIGFAGPTRGQRLRRLRLLVAVFAPLAVIAALPGQAGAAAPGSPGLPQPATTVFEEDFQNNTGTTPVPLTSYVGASGATYTADPAWLSNCNGSVIEGDSPSSLWPTVCPNQAGFDALRQLSYAQGVYQAAPDPYAVHTVAALTAVNVGANKVQFQTAAPIPLTTSNRFLTLSLDVAGYCTGNNPSLSFSLMNGATAIPVFNSPIDPCTDPRGVPVPVPAIGVRGAATLRVGTYVANGSTLFAGSDVGIQIVNGQGAGAGNDSAFTNVRILDVTPQLDKAFSPAAVNAGGVSTLTFTITNTDELGEKNGWSFTDNLPAGLTIAGAPNASTTCSGGTVTAAAAATSIAASGNLTAGQASCTVSVDVTSPTAGTFTNSASNVAPSGVNAPGSATVQFLAADVQIVKSTSGVLVPGEQTTYTLTARNNGPGDASNVVVSDPLPSGLTFVSADSGCAEANRTVTCSIASLANGASQTFSVRARVAASADDCAELRNTATVSSDVLDPDTSNNTSTVCNFEQRANRTITKVASGRQVPSGGQVTYTIVVENTGPGDDSNVTVSEPMAPGLALVAAAPSQGNCSTTGGTVSCNLGALKAGGSAQILVTATVSAASGCITNTATVTGDAFDPTAGDDRAAAEICVEVPVVPAPPPTPDPVAFDLAVDKRSSTSQVVVGQRLTYKIVVRNNGPSAAPAAKLTDTYNTRATVVSVRTSQGTCTRRLPVTCELGRIEAGASATVTMVIKPRQSGRARNAASATSCCGTDTTSSNDMDTADIRVRKVALQLSKAASRAQVDGGDTLSYRIRVRNPTKGEARDVKVCDRLPSGLRYVGSARQGVQRCWTIKTLGAGKSRTFRVTVRVARGAQGRKVNRVTATSPDTLRRTARAPIRVRGLATPVTG